MKFVNWRYPDARVFVRYDKGSGFEKTIRRAVGVIVGQCFIGVMIAKPGERRVGLGSAHPSPDFAGDSGASR